MTTETTIVNIPNDAASLAHSPRGLGSFNQGIQSGKYGQSGPRFPHSAWDLQYAQLNKTISGFETADEIADFFRKEGIKGYRGEIESCPIANYVSAGCGGKVQMDDKSLITIDPTNPEKEVGWVLEHTPAMAEFIKRFDAGDYPDLVAA